MSEQKIQSLDEVDEASHALTPTVIVGYLVGYWLWVYFRPRCAHFATEPYDCSFLLVVAALLWRAEHVNQIRSYFVGRLLPRRADLPKALLVLILLAGWWIVSYISGWLVIGESAPDWLELVDDVITSPITEEIVYRGVILTILLQHSRSGRWTPLILSALAFAGYHAVSEFFPLLMIFGAGLILGYAYMATRCILLCVLCHALWNAAFAVVPPLSRLG